MNARGQRIIVFGDSLSKHGADAAPEIWDVDTGSNRTSSAPGDLLASLLAEQGAEAVRINARVGRSAWNFWARENTVQLISRDAAFRPTKVVIMLGTNDVGLNATLDREAFAKLRDTYKQMGAEVWAIGPFSNTSKPDQGVDIVARTMRDVFGSRFIDGRPLSTLIHPGGDGLHYTPDGARVLALAMADALISKLSASTVFSTAALGAIGVGGALAIAYAVKRKRGLGEALALADIEGLSRKDEKMIQETLKLPGVESLDVAADALLERGERVSTFAKTGGEVGEGTKAYFQLDLGRDKITWWVQRKGMGRCEATFNVHNDGVLIGDGMIVNAGGGREPKSFVENYGSESSEYCERSAASTAWQIAKTLKRMPNMPSPMTAPPALITNAMNDVRDAIKKDLDQDHSEPEELYGLGDPSDDQWDVARDAIIEGDAKRAAKIWKQLRDEHGFVTAPKSFLDVLHEAPSDVRWDWYKHTADEEAGLGAERSGLQAKREIVELLRQDNTDARIAARDLALDHGLLKTGTVERVISIDDEYPGVSIITIDGQDFATGSWTYDQHGSLSKKWRPEVGEAIDYIPTHEEPYIKSRHTTGKLPTINSAMMFEPSAPSLPESVLKRWINKFWPKDDSPDLEGASDDFTKYQAKKHLPEAEARQKFADMIREDDPDIMELAEDFALEQEIPLADKGRKRSGAFALNPLNPADAPQTVVYWSVGAQGRNQSDVEIVVDFNRAAFSDLHDHIEAALKQARKRAEHVMSRQEEEEIANRVIDQWVEKEGVKLTGHKIDLTFREPFKPDLAARMAAAIAWDTAKRIKRLPADADEDTVRKAMRDALAQRDHLLATKPGLYGPGQKKADVSFHELIREDDPAAMNVAEDFLLERGWKMREVTGGMNAKHFTIELKPMSGPKDEWKMVQAHVHEPENPTVLSQHRSEAAARRALKKAPSNATIIHEPPTTRTNERWLVAQKRYEIEVDIANGSVRTRRHFFIVPEDGADLRKRAVADAWAIAKAIKPLPLDTPRAEVERVVNKVYTDGDPMHREELFGLGAVNIVDGKRSNESEAALVRSGARKVTCKSGLDRKQLATCWSRAMGLGKPGSMLTTIAAESATADEFVRRAEAWAGTEAKPPSDRAIAKAWKRGGVTAAMIAAAREERQKATLQRFRKLERGLKGFRVAYQQAEVDQAQEPSSPKRVRNRRIYAVNQNQEIIVYPTIESAMKGFRALKRRGLWAWVEDEDGNHVPVKGAMRPFKTDIGGLGRKLAPRDVTRAVVENAPLGDDRDDAIAYAIRDSAKRAGGWKGSRKVFVSDVFEQLREDGRDDGLSIDEFKTELVRLNRAGKLKLARADLVAAMPGDKVAASEINARGATFHFVNV